MGQLRMFGANIHLLIGLLLALGILFVLVIGAWTGIKVGLWQLDRRRHARAFHAMRHDGLGRKLPPASPGFCDVCRRAERRVFHLPSGERRCETCLDAEASVSA